MADLFQFGDDLLSDVDELKPVTPTVVLKPLLREHLDFVRPNVQMVSLLSLFLLAVFLVERAPPLEHKCTRIRLRHLELLLHLAEQLACLWDGQAFQSLLAVEFHLKLLGPGCLLFSLKSRERLLCLVIPLVQSVCEFILALLVVYALKQPAHLVAQLCIRNPLVPCEHVLQILLQVERLIAL